MANVAAAPTAGANGSQAKNATNTKNFGASFAPGFTINVNAGNKTNTGAPASNRGGGGAGAPSPCSRPRSSAPPRRSATTATPCAPPG